jgi:hypothetical protein
MSNRYNRKDVLTEKSYKLVLNLNVADDHIIALEAIWILSFVSLKRADSRLIDFVLFLRIFNDKLHSIL